MHLEAKAAPQADTSPSDLTALTRYYLGEAEGFGFEFLPSHRDEGSIVQRQRTPESVHIG